MVNPLRHIRGVQKKVEYKQRKEEIERCFGTVRNIMDLDKLICKDVAE